MRQNYGEAPGHSPVQDPWMFVYWVDRTASCNVTAGKSQHGAVTGDEGARSTMGMSTVEMSVVETTTAGIRPFSGPLWATGRIPVVRADDTLLETRNRVTLCVTDARPTGRSATAPSARSLPRVDERAGTEETIVPALKGEGLPRSISTEVACERSRSPRAVENLLSRGTGRWSVHREPRPSISPNPPETWWAPDGVAGGQPLHAERADG